MLCIIFFSTSTPGGDQHHSVRSREEENVGNDDDDDVGNADIKTRQEISVNVVIVGGTEAEAQHR